MTLPGWPRYLSRELAAAYVGVSVSAFDQEVTAGWWPPPRRRGAKASRATWDRKLPTDQDVSRRAYQIWQDAGSPDGHYEERWAEAQSELGGSAGDNARGAEPLTPTKAEKVR